MATVVADADVEIRADLSKFGADLQRKLTPILKKIVATIDVVANTDKFSKGVDSAVKAAEKRTATIKVKADTKDVDDDVATARRRVDRSRPATLKVKVDIDKDVDKDTSSFLKKIGKLGTDAGTKLAQFLSDSLSNGLSGLQEISGKITASLAQGLIGLAAAGATIAIGLPAAAGAIVALSSAIITLLPLAVALAAPLGALGLVAAALFVGFRDFQDALEGDEEALKRLSPSAKSVLNVFNDFKPVLLEIQKAAQEALFFGLADPLRELATTVLPIAKEALVEVAQTINGVLVKAVQFFNSQEGNQLLVTFFDNITEVVKEVARLAPAAGKAIVGIINVGAKLGREILPEIISKLDSIIVKLGQFVESGALETSFNKAVVFAKQLFEIIKSIFNITKIVGTAFLEGFTALIPSDEDKGQLDTFIESLNKMAETLQNPLVQQGIRGIGTALFLLIAALGLAALAVGLLITALVELPKKLVEIVKSVVDFTNKLREKWDQIGIDVGGFVSNVTTQLSGLPSQAGQALSGLGGAVQQAFQAAMTAAVQALNNGRTAAVNAISSIKASITNSINALPAALFQAGKTMISSLASGMLSQLGSVTKSAGAIVSGIKNFFPHSPPKEGPMSGSGYTDESGKVLVQDFASGIVSQAGTSAKAAAKVMQNVANEIGIGATGRFNSSAFDVASPNLAGLRGVGTSRVIPSSSSNTSNVTNKSRNFAPVINVTVQGGGDGDAAANAIVRRLLTVGV